MEIIEVLDQNQILIQGQIQEIAQVTQGYLGPDLASMIFHIETCAKPKFHEKLNEALKMTMPSGFKSGIGSVQLNPLSWDKIGGLQDVKTKLQSAVSETVFLYYFSSNLLNLIQGPREDQKSGGSETSILPKISLKSEK